MQKAGSKCFKKIAHVSGLHVGHDAECVGKVQDEERDENCILVHLIQAARQRVGLVRGHDCKMVTQ